MQESSYELIFLFQNPHTVQVLSPVSAFTICFHFADWQKYFCHKFGASEWRINEEGTPPPPSFTLVWIHYGVLNTKNLIIFQQQMGVLHEGVLP
jgi:hypothetical protein